MLDLLPWQRRVCAAAVTTAALAALAAAATGVFVLLTRFINHFSGVFGPLLVAVLLSLLLEPVCDALERRLRLPRVAAILTLYLLVVATASALALVLLPALWEQLQSLSRVLPDKWDQLTRDIGDRFPAAATWLRDGGLLAWLKGHTQELVNAAGSGATLLGSASGKLGGLLARVTGLAIIPVYLFYLLDLRRDFVGDLERESASLLPEKVRRDLIFLVRQFIDILVAFFRGQLLIGLILGALLAGGFWATGIAYGLLLGLFMGLGNIIPYLGTMLGLAAVIPIAYLQDDGGGAKVGAALGVIIAVQLLDAYLVTPKIMGKTTGLHPMAIIVSVFFWSAALDGMLGLLLAVPLTAFVVVFWRLLKERHLPRHA